MAQVFSMKFDEMLFIKVNNQKFISGCFLLYPFLCSFPLPSFLFPLFARIEVSPYIQRKNFGALLAPPAERMTFLATRHVPWTLNKYT